MDQNPNAVPRPENIPSPIPTPTPALNLQPQLPSFSVFWNQALEKFKAHWMTYVGIAILPFAISFIAGFFMIKAFSLGFFIVYFIIYYFVYILSMIATFLVATDRVSPPVFSEAYRASLSFLFPFLWVGILSTLAIFGGVALLIVPGIIISILLIFSTFAFFSDDKKGMSALVASWYYTRNFKAAIVGRLMLLGLIYIAISIPIGFFAYLSPELSNVLTAIIGAIFTPFWTIFAFLIFKTLKVNLPPPAPEEEAKIAGKIKIFSWIGIIAAIVFLVGMIFLFRGLSKAFPGFFDAVKGGYVPSIEQTI